MFSANQCTINYSIIIDEISNAVSMRWLLFDSDKQMKFQPNKLVLNVHVCVCMCVRACVYHRIVFA